MINSFTYNGKNTAELGLYVGGQHTFGAPQRDVTKVAIPGRNGDLVRDNGRFLNSEIMYNIVAMNEFAESAKNVRNWLMRSSGYHRLEDTYDPDHFRMARVAGTVDFETGAYNATGKTQVTFDCMPQRFLKSGETVISCDPVERSASGEIASFETDYVVPMTSAEVSFSPVQDLNGYDSPWPAGGGKNKLNILPLTPIKVENGITFTVNNDGTVTANGTATSQCQIYWRIPADIAKTFGNMVLDVLDGQVNSGITGILEEAAPPYTRYANTTWYPVISDAIANISAANANLSLQIQQGTTVNNFLLKPMIRPADSASGFAPYTNICPISGNMGVELKIGATYPTAVNTYSVTFADHGTVYGGTVDLVSGKLTVEEWGNIASYNGENITEPWLSSMDVYSAGATPTTGAQVVYKLATPPLEYALSPQQIETLQGENNVWSDAGEISLTFYDPAELDNPTPFDSKPLIRAYGSGNGQVTIGNQIIALTDIDGYIDIDCETMNCYNGVENCNSKVTLGAQGFPTLPPGITAVSFGGGVTKVEITPRWWEL